MKQRRNKIIGMFLILSTLVSLGFWELWGRSNLGSEKMLVLKKSVQANTQITEEMLTVKPMEHPGQGTLPAREAARIAGKAAKQYIPAGEPLYEAYFEEPQFLVGEKSGKYILALPEQWIAAYPQTVRRGDRIFFYCGGAKVTDAVVVHAKDSNNQEVRSDGAERLADSGSVSKIEVAVAEKQAQMLAKLADKGNRFLLLYQ